jgi:hypothetical protein
LVTLAIGSSVLRDELLSPVHPRDVADACCVIRSTRHCEEQVAQSIHVTQRAFADWFLAAKCNHQSLGATTHCARQMQAC